MAMAEPTYELQAAIEGLLAEAPELERSLSEMIAYEEQNADGLKAYREGTAFVFEDKATWQNPGWVWQSVHTPPGVINRLVVKGIVDMTSQSRSSTHYRLVSVQATKEALEMVRPGSVVREVKAVNIDDLFGLIIGQERVKTLIKLALLASEPVHVFLVGPPACAKTMFLEEVSRLNGARYYVGSTTTKAGLTTMLLIYQPRYLLIDEMNTMDRGDMTPLLTLMQSQKVIRLQARHEDEVPMQTWVFAGANDIRNLSPAILSRAKVEEISEYSKDEFRRVTYGVLTQQKGVKHDVAIWIAEAVAEHTRDIRVSRRVAAMAQAFNGRDVPIDEIAKIVKLLFPNALVTSFRPVVKG